MENMLIDETDPAIEGICGFDLMIQTKKVFIVSKINEKKLLPSEDDWAVIKTIPIPEIGESLLNKYVELLGSYIDPEGKSLFLECIKPYFQSIDIESAANILYAGLLKRPVEISNIIVESNLFSAKHICSLIGNHLLTKNILIRLLSADKAIYTSDDLVFMKDICTKLHNLPDIRNVKTKKGLFVGEKEVSECGCGKTFDMNIEYCPHCLKNNKGFLKEQQDVVDFFIKKVEILEGLLRKNN